MTFLTQVRPLLHPVEEYTTIAQAGDHYMTL